MYVPFAKRERRTGLYCIYSLTDPFNLELFYIGKTQHAKYRFLDHRSRSKSVNLKLRHRFDCIEVRNSLPTFEIIKDGLSAYSAKILEKKIIEKLNPSCNIQHNTKNQRGAK